MSSRRTMVLIAAIAMGALAAFVLRNYINDQEQKANPQPVTVYVITRDIKRGEPFTTAEQMGIKKTTMPVKYRPSTFIEDTKALQGKVAATNLAANQVLVENMFVISSVEATGLRNRLTDNMVAIAVPIEGVRAVGGLLQPGDEVNIMVTPQEDEEGSGSSEGAPTTTVPKTPGASTIDPKVSPYANGARYLYQKVRILSIGSSVRPDATEVVAPTASSATVATSGGSIVFEVPASAAQTIASIDPASFYLVLIKENWNLAPLPALNPEDIKNGAALPGEDPAKLTPYGPKGFPNPVLTTTTTAAPTTTKAN